jgi:hypothetical protein
MAHLFHITQDRRQVELDMANLPPSPSLDHLRTMLANEYKFNNRLASKKRKLERKAEDDLVRVQLSSLDSYVTNRQTTTNRPCSACMQAKTIELQETNGNLKVQLRSANQMINRVQDDSAQLKQQLREEYQRQEEQAPLPQPEEEMCGICMCSMTTSDQTCVPMVGTCGHSYCEACLVSRGNA